MTHDELIREIKKTKIQRILSKSQTRKAPAAKVPAIYGTINKRIAESYGIELEHGNVIQYR